MNNYRHFRSTNGDVLRRQIKSASVNEQWTIKNNLPTKLVLYIEYWLSGKQTLLTEIQPRQTLKFPANKFADRDQLFAYAYINDLQKNSVVNKNEMILIMEPYTIREIWKNITLGDIGYRSTDGQRHSTRTYSDLSGVYFINQFKVPINIFYGGNLVAQAGARDGLTYLGGSKATVFFDNNRQGLDFLSTVTIGYNLKGNQSKILTFLLNDIQSQNIYVGTIEGGFVGPDPDQSVYEVDYPVYNSLTYFNPSGRGNSVQTNPTRPYDFTFG